MYKDSLMGNMISYAMEKMDLGSEQSFKQGFFTNIAKEKTVSKSNLRLELAQAMNRKKTITHKKYESNTGEDCKTS